VDAAEVRERLAFDRLTMQAQAIAFFGGSDLD
jgi:hypothetical protein